MSSIIVISQCQSGQAQLVLINESEAPVVMDGVYLAPEGSPSSWSLVTPTQLSPGQEYVLDLTPILIPMCGNSTAAVQDKTVEIRLDLGVDLPIRELTSRHNVTLQDGVITHFSNDRTVYRAVG